MEKRWQKDYNLVRQCLRLRKYNRVLKITEKYVKSNKVNSTLLDLRAYALVMVGNLNLADDTYKAALTLDPESPSIKNNYGLLKQQRHEFVSALKLHSSSLYAENDNENYFLNWCQSFRGVSLSVAEEDVSSIVSPILNDISFAYKVHKLSDYDLKVQIINYAYAQKQILTPVASDFYKILYLLIEKKIYKAWKEIFKLNCNSAVIDLIRGEISFSIGDYRLAKESYQKYLSSQPDNLDAKLAITQIYTNLGEIEPALSILNELKEVPVAAAEAYLNIGVIYQAQGAIDMAERAYRAALRWKPDFHKAFRNLCALDTLVHSDSLIQDKLKDLKIDQINDVDLLFALFSIFNRNCEYATATRFLERGNQIANEKAGYNPEHISSTYLKIENSYKNIQYKASGENVVSKKIKAEFSPLFIIGLPRSGTTFLEQILTVHPKIGSFGEEEALTLSFLEAADETDVDPTNFLMKLREGYLRRVLCTKSIDNVYMIDKMPHNYRFLGFIFQSLPEAKVISIKRNKNAVLFSNFATHFPAEGMNYTNSAEGLKHNFDLYKRYMDLYSEKPGNKFLELQYEDVVSDISAAATNIFDFLDLEWRNEYLDSFGKGGVVSSASNLQIRRGILKNTGAKHLEYMGLLPELFN